MFVAYGDSLKHQAFVQVTSIWDDRGYCFSEHRTKIREDSEIVTRVINWQTQLRKGRELGAVVRELRW